ncbi:MAG TPA: pyridoxamine 5'-phosphate oxidase family protein [Ktedonobacterales bacterium]|nr:pyridoxamine 5'-phosphate oxidase family protein [Ktedonobacterales bacterium]
MVSEPAPTRQRGFIPWSWVDRQLRAIRSIWVSTTRPDGRPHAVPVWLTWDGRALYFATGERAQKARNLQHEPWVVIHAGDGDDVIILEGSAEAVTDDLELRQVDAARAEKYVSQRTGARDTILTPGTIVYRVAVGRVMAWQYGNMAGRTDWLFEGVTEGASGVGE